MKKPLYISSQLRQAYEGDSPDVATSFGSSASYGSVGAIACPPSSAEEHEREGSGSGTGSASGRGSKEQPSKVVRSVNECTIGYNAHMFGLCVWGKHLFIR